MILMPPMSMGIKNPIGQKIPQFPIVKFTVSLVHG
jgi:hypothetical protein